MFALYGLLCDAVFFFKQKTAYEMRISDWSSDVCSSDLDLIIERAVDPRFEPVADGAADVQPRVGIVGVAAEAQRMVRSRHHEIIGIETEDELAMFPLAFALHLDRAERRVLDRSEEHTSELQSLMRI